MDIERFKHDHVAIMLTVKELRDLAHAGIAEHADAIARKLMEMSAVVKLHLATEDRVLYPALAAHSGTQAIGKRYQDEMGGLSEAYAAFVLQWGMVKHISADPDGFRDAANGVFKALHQRVQSENRELYPLAETL